MNINRKDFFASVRAHRIFGATLKQDHVAGCTAILDACDDHGVTDIEEIAYILATAKHETAHTMRPIKEYGRGKGRTYGRPHKTTGQTYYGRGYVQLTWHRNYERMGKMLGIDLVGHPDEALNPLNAANIIVLGMRDGLFAPAAGPLSKYLGKAEDWLGARKTVNGRDRAALIAAIARKFDKAIETSINAHILPPHIPTYKTPPKTFKPTWQKLLDRLLSALIERFTT